MRTLFLWLAILFVPAWPAGATFSIVAIDPITGDLGVAVASRYFAVGAVVPWADAGVGAIATQAGVNVGYGPRALELLRQGLTAQQVLDRLMQEDTFPRKDARQVAIVDAKGNIAVFTGDAANAWRGHLKGKTWSAQGNILVGQHVVEAMGRAFDATNDELAEKLYAALKAGDDAGGDSRKIQRESCDLMIGCSDDRSHDLGDLEIKRSRSTDLAISRSPDRSRDHSIKRSPDSARTSCGV